ncbi:hypothetical protein FRC06_000690 [Ceratobasidium sp. 370]|nr:hypothetical protein FRC06_000690 [Ceratobasidium sp. 370]
MPAICTKYNVACAARLKSQLYYSDIGRCGAFGKAYEYAKSIDPTVELGYIPMAERWECYWVSPETLRCPRRGDLLWVGEGPRPEGTYAMQKTRLYVARKCVANSVRRVVEQSKDKCPNIEWHADGSWWVRADTVTGWVDNAVEGWRKQVPESYWGSVNNLNQQVVFNLILAKFLTRDQFWDWLDQQAWDQANLMLAKDMEALGLGRN